MLFNSLSFLIFFPCVLLVYFVIPRRIRYIWLLLASYFFYMCWEPSYAILMFASTFFTWAASLLIDRFSGSTAKKKAVVAVNLLINFGILFVFKYFGFFMGSIASVCARFGITFTEPKLSLLLPVGISFYIFQAVGYTIDVYRGQVEPERNLLKYALFVSFFPQLVAGPIERSDHFLPQLRRIDKMKLFKPKRIREGAFIMLYGYILKMIIADRAAAYVDVVFSAENYAEYPGFYALIAIVLFAVQIYTDFAGYTAIAIGSAKIMGFELIDNFNAPYLALSLKDFWGRWHMSLTNWFRDYLYIPLGGNRKGKLRKYFNIMVTFLLSGLWHGAAWHYVVWGGIHGVLRVLGEATEKLRVLALLCTGIKRDSFSHKIFRRIVTFAEVCFAWTFFRADSFHQAIDILKSIVTGFNPWVLTDGGIFNAGLDAKDWNVLILALVFMIVADFLKNSGRNVAAEIASQNLVFQAVLMYVGIFAVIIFGMYGPAYDAAQFIYFQF